MSRPDQAPEGSSTGLPGADDTTVTTSGPDTVTAGADPGTGPAPVADGLGAAVVALIDGNLEQARRRSLLGRLVGEVRSRSLGGLFRPTAVIRWLTEAIGDVAPHIPIRGREALRQHFPGLDDNALAERLIRNAARATAGIGAAGGGVAAVEWVVAPTLLSAPVLLAAETVAVVAIELKLIGELHEVYGVSLPHGTAQRAVAIIHAWSSQRGGQPVVPGVSVGTVLGVAARRELREMLLKRLGRNLTTLGPLFTGAAVASYLNRRATRGLGHRVREDLCDRQRVAVRRQRLTGDSDD